MHDLAIIIVSTNEGHWLRPCLSSIFERVGDAEVEVVIADNESTDVTASVVAEFSGARLVQCANHGFGHANNRALVTSDARYALFLNPDTEILSGTFSELVAAMDARASVGLVGVRQLSPDGTVFPTMRRFPNAIRALGEAFGSERLPVRAGWLGERELDLDRYEHEVNCDWTSGSFMLARKEALESAGFFDERYFIYSEEPDLCLRIKKAGWEVRHLPVMTILHHADKAGISPKVDAQDVFSRLQYAAKHFAFPHRMSYRFALFIRHALRYVAVSERRQAAAKALRVLLGREGSPYAAPPPRAVVTLRTRQS